MDLLSYIWMDMVFYEGICHLHLGDIFGIWTDLWKYPLMPHLYCKLIFHKWHGNVMLTVYHMIIL